MKERLTVLCGEIEPCDTFADVGCDHGFCMEYALRHGLCRYGIAADISEHALRTAERRLARFVNQGRCRLVVCDGLAAIPKDVDLVMIAGMGGDLICRILDKDFIPRRMILQPMTDARAVREYLLCHGCRIIRDKVFAADRIYDLISAERASEADSYSERELEFGRDNLRTYNPAFCAKLEKLMELQREYIKKSPKESVSESLRQRLLYLEEIYDGIRNGNIGDTRK